MFFQMIESLSWSFWVTVVLFGAPFAVLLFYIYNLNYWRLKGVKSPPTDSFFGGHLDTSNLFHPPRNFILQKWTREYGSVYGILLGWTKTWVIADYKLAHEVFVKKFDCFYARKPSPLAPDVSKSERVHVFNANGARWKRLRTISSPSFSNNNLKRIFPIVDDSCQKLMKFVDQAWAKDEPFNIHPYYHELTMEIICRIAMGQKESTLFDNEYVEMVKNVIDTLGTTRFEKVATICPVLAPLIRRLFVLYNQYFAMTPSMKMFYNLNNNVRERKRQKAVVENGKIDTGHVDFIDLFLEAEDPNITDGTFDKMGMKVEKRLTIDEVIQMCFIFLTAGFDTTANTLVIVTWLLTVHPDIQQRLLEEIDDVIGDGEITFDRINDLRYLDVIMKETLRMYPIASFACARECTETTFLGDFRIQKGENINIDVLTMHYDQAVWGENAAEFVPERFFDLTAAQQMSYYPFGGGPRICIGMRLAYLEVKACLARILMKYKFVGGPETEKELKMVGRILWNPENGVTVKLEKR